MLAYHCVSCCSWGLSVMCSDVSMYTLQTEFLSIRIIWVLKEVGVREQWGGRGTGRAQERSSQGVEGSSGRSQGQGQCLPRMGGAYSLPDSLCSVAQGLGPEMALAICSAPNKAFYARESKSTYVLGREGTAEREKEGTMLYLVRMSLRA